MLLGPGYINIQMHSLAYTLFVLPRILMLWTLTLRGLNGRALITAEQTLDRPIHLLILVHWEILVHFLLNLLMLFPFSPYHRRDL